ncbi:hypothetical protein Poly30_36860 [Planctomycetes bacterium Poly30]|uniref:Uncharacterized protein n=1 Tax=Saltatorellus ferox TaxID=2528018 RepID=A0A518EVM6_9BACT|nr:hypothetical protein Poly30_36860 [Planctomycetes bacterium Poly30]
MQLAKPLSTLGVLLFVSPALAQSPTVVGFDGGSDGGFIGNAVFEATGGNPDGNAHHAALIFFNELRTGGIGEPVNPNLIGDYSGFGSVTFEVDIKVDSLTDFIGNDIARPFGLKLIDRDITGPNGSSGVYVDLAVLSSFNQPNWTRVSVTIDDPTSAALPPGWIGFGDDDPTTFEPILPAGATFASVLASVDEVHLTGATPGFFFNDANFDMRIDNVTFIVTDPSLGTETCSGVANSTGAGADLSLSGSNVASANNLTVQVNSLPSNSLGYVIHSLGNAVVANPGGSEGNLCLAGASIGRFNSQVLDSGAAGAVSFSPDLTSLPAVGGPVSAVAGETRYFQLWYRDNVGGVATSNFSSADGITFQ